MSDHQDYTLTVTVGRNVDNAPMAREDWQRFQDALDDWANLWLREVYFRGVGHGYSPQWGVEEAYTVVGDWWSVRIWQDAESDLDALREEFGQEAVAVTRGRTFFV